MEQNKKIKPVVLRELTTQEKDDLAHIKLVPGEEAEGVLFGMVAMDTLMDWEKKDSVITFPKLVNRICYDIKCNVRFEIINSWIEGTMTYKQYGNALECGKNEVRGYLRDNDTALNILRWYICNYAIPPYGTKQKALGVLFEEIDSKSMLERNIDILNDPEIVMRFVLTCLEYCGFKRKDKQPEEFTLDMSGLRERDLIA